jgi:3'(2'), 5'-bisphosphate nucleotidase
MVLVSSRSHRKQIVDDIRRSLRITSERRTGSVGLKVGQIARQLADIYIHPSPGCKEWDICAPEAVLRAAGGQITDCWGNPLEYNKRDVRAHNGVIASNGVIHNRIIETVSHIVEAAGFNEDDGFW